MGQTIDKHREGCANTCNSNCSNNSAHAHSTSIRIAYPGRWNDLTRWPPGLIRLHPGTPTEPAGTRPFDQLSDLYWKSRCLQRHPATRQAAGKNIS
jgi:hypothetical protein